MVVTLRYDYIPQRIIDIKIQHGEKLLRLGQYKSHQNEIMGGHGIQPRDPKDLNIMYTPQSKVETLKQHHKWSTVKWKLATKVFKPLFWKLTLDSWDIRKLRAEGENYRTHNKVSIQNSRWRNYSQWTWLYLHKFIRKDKASLNQEDNSYVGF